MIVCIPTGIIGLIADDWLDAHLYNSIVVSLMFIKYGIIYIVIENKNIDKQQTDEVDKITYKQVMMVRCF